MNWNMGITALACLALGAIVGATWTALMLGQTSDLSKRSPA